MKLLFAIVSHEDSKSVVKKLLKHKFGVTKLASSGGFLSSGNNTLMICLPKERVDEAIGLIKEECATRTEKVVAPVISGFTSAYSPYPVEVFVGGATVFVTDIERFEKL